jgi:hypothetical protein
MIMLRFPGLCLLRHPFLELRKPAAVRRARPLLEVLEDRTLPTVFNVGAGAMAPGIVGLTTAGTSAQSGPASGGGSVSAPPNLFQALLSLSLDGATLELENLALKFIPNIDEFPLNTPQAEANAAAAGFNFDMILGLSSGLSRLMGHDRFTATSDIQSNLLSTGPLGLLAVAAGAQAADQAVQMPIPLQGKPTESAADM